MSKNFLKALNAEQGEGLAVFLFLFLGWFLGGILALTEVTAISMFLKSWDSSHFPLAFLIAGISGLLTAHLYTKLQNWIPLSALAFFSLILLFLGELFIFYSYRIEKSDWIVYMAMVYSSSLMIIMLQIFESFLQNIFDSTQTRRWRNRSEMGIVVGIIFFLMGAFIMIERYALAPEYFFLISALLIAGAGIAVIAFSFNFPSLNHITSNVQYIHAHNNYPSFIKAPYKRSIVMFTLLSSMSHGLIDYFFYLIVASRYETTFQTITYLAIFSIVFTALGSILSSFAAERLANKYGYKILLLLLPSCVAIFTLLYAIISFKFGFQPADDSFYLLFMIIGICKLLYMILYKGFEQNTFRAYFIPIEQTLRFDLQGKVETFFRQLGKSTAAGLLVIALVLMDWQIFDLPWAMVLTSIGWVIATIVLHKWYRITLKQSLEKEEFVLQKEKRLSSYIDQLVYSSKNIESHHLPLHLNILAILDPIQYKRAILTILDSENDEVQRIALYQAGELCLLDAIPILDEVQKTKYYPISRNRELIRRTYNRLKGAEFRLEKLKYIEQLTFSKIISERRFGALLAAYSEDIIKPKLLNKLFHDKDSKVRFNAVTASACSEAYELQKNLIENLTDSRYSNAAISAIAASGNRMLPLLESTFHLTGQTEKVQNRIILIYSRIATKEAIDLLIKKLNYSNHNIISASIDGLSRCGITITGERSIQFRREVDETCQLLIWNMSIYNDLKRQEASSLLLTSVKYEIQENYNSLFKILALLYDPQSVSLVKANINSGDPDKTEFASELLDVFVADELKPILLPIISVDAYETIVWKMNEYFPVTSMSSTEILYDLIQRDYKLVNRWTKACAMQELASNGTYYNYDIFAANLVNPDIMLRETAAMLLFKISKVDFKTYQERFKQEFNYQNGNEIISKKILLEIAEKDHSPALKFEMIRFLNNLPEFNSIPGIILMEIVKVMEFIEFKKEELVARYESFDYFDYYIVQKGSVQMIMEEKSIQVFNETDFIHAQHYINTEEHILLKLEALEDTSLYKLKQEDFHDLISRFEEIPRSFLTSHYSTLRKQELIEQL